MKNHVPIKRYMIAKKSTDFPTIKTFFTSTNWECSKSDIFLLKNTSVHFQISSDAEAIYIDVWGLGAFGRILPSIESQNGFLSYPIVSNAQKEFIEFLNRHEIHFDETTTEKESISPILYYSLFVITIIAGVLLMFIIFPYSK